MAKKSDSKKPEAERAEAHAESEASQETRNFSALRMKEAFETNAATSGAEIGSPREKVLLGSYLVIIAALGTWFVVRSWPQPAAADGVGNETIERDLILVALASGIVGACVHAIQSFVAYVGNNEYRVSWRAWYLLRPAIGALLGLLVYFVVRAGFVQGGATNNGDLAVNPHGIAAICGLAGLFSKQATDKLEELVETLFARRDPNTATKLKDKLSSKPNVPGADDSSPADEGNSAAGGEPAKKAKS